MKNINKYTDLEVKYEKPAHSGSVINFTFKSTYRENIFEKKCTKFNTKDLFSENDFFTIGDVCHIGNGMVSGLDKAFQVEEIENLTNEEINYSIQVVKARIKGDIESPVIETLLMFNPNYQKNPIEELNDKFIQTYNSKDNPKAKGVDFSVKVPKSWKSQEANRPNIVRKFTSNNGYIIEDTFIENIMILVYDLPIEVKKLTSQDVTDVCNDIPENSVLRECKATTLENLPVVVQRLKLNMKRLENSMNMEVVQYNVFYKNKMIIIQGQVGTMNEKISEKTLLERFEKFKPVFNYVANSLMISNLYKQRRIK